MALDRDGNTITTSVLNGILGALGGNSSSSLWDGLSPHLIAKFYEVDRKGKRVIGGAMVQAPLTESSLEVSLSWQSPFENTGSESKAPMLAAMLQSGELQPLVDNVMGDGKVKSGLDKAIGRTGITKLNSTQVFSGMPPAKIQVTVLFRAWRDPIEEVEKPFGQLMKWALPIELASNATFLTGLLDIVGGNKSAVEGILPSKSPTMIAIEYKNKVYSPLVIESILEPLNSPIDAKGNFTELSVPITLTTLTAIDRADWHKMSGGGI